jgi:hypothetical protein
MPPSARGRDVRRDPRSVRDQIVEPTMLETVGDIRGWYVSGTCRVTKRFALGSYYSRYSIISVSGGPLHVIFPLLFPNQTDTSLPANHVYDKVITARIDLNRYWNAKISWTVSATAPLPTASISK